MFYRLIKVKPRTWTAEKRKDVSLTKNDLFNIGLE